MRVERYARRCGSVGVYTFVMLLAAEISERGGGAIVMGWWELGSRRECRKVVRG